MKHLIHDRDASFGAAFDAVFTAAGIDVIRTGIRTPHHNSILERRFRTLRAELTDLTLIWNLDQLLRLLREYETFYNEHWPHRSPRPIRTTATTTRQRRRPRPVPGPDPDPDPTT